MQAEGPRTPYEISCSRCLVTFPVGTKRCLHCGGRLTREGARQSIVFPPPTDIPEELPEEESSKRGSRISPISVLWIVAALGVAIQRACAS
jgi:hypothetical protein